MTRKGDRTIKMILVAVACGAIAACGSTDNEPGPGTTGGTSYQGNLYDSSPATPCGEHIAAGDPGASDQFLCRKGYALGYNYTTRLANWVQYRITAASVTPRVPRNDNFREDNDIIPGTARATLTDYSGSGYDRGHLAPAATMDFDYQSMDESFLLSNIAPQLPGFNRDGWAELEQYVRDCAIDQGELVIVTGPIFTSTSPRNIGSGVVVPDAYYKAILKPESPAKGFAFIIPHAAISETELEDYITTIDAVEAATGLDLYAAMRDAIEGPVEASTKAVCPLPWQSSDTGGGGGFGACGSKSRCGQMTSCDEAYYYLNTCGVSSLDRDKDGIPCESICR